MNKNMRIIYLLRAMPGAGKSTLIDTHDLRSNTLSFDTFRELFSGQSIGLDGKMSIDQQYNDLVTYYFKEALKKRMQERSIIIVDNLNNKVSDLNGYNSIAKRNGYIVKVVNFDLKELDFYKERNKLRTERKQLSHQSLERVYKTFKNANLGECIPEIISVNDFVLEITTPISELAVNLDSYEKIHHIGDILGSSFPFKQVLDNYNESDFYIFVGNYFDLGNSPDIVCEGLKSIYDKNNVVFIRGNYDNKLGFFVNDLDVHDDLFNDLTKSKLEPHKYFIKDFYYNQKDYFVYSHNDHNVFVNNAGVINLPKRPYLVNASTFTEGIGSNVYDVGNQFNKNAQNGWIQVHGYRNFTGQRDENIKNRSFSLATGVAVGGVLTDFVVSDNGFSLLEYKNKEYNKEIKKIYDSQFFQSFNNSEKIELENSTSSNNMNDGVIYYFDDIEVSTVNGSIVSIKKEDNSNPYATIWEKDVKNLFVSSSEDTVIVVDENLNILKGLNIPNGIIELTKKFNSIAHCSYDKDGIVILDFYHKDKDKNKLKKSLYENFNTKSNVLFFKDQNSLEGFLKSIQSGRNKKYSGDLVVRYSNGKKEEILNNPKVKKRNRNSP